MKGLIEISLRHLKKSIFCLLQKTYHLYQCCFYLSFKEDTVTMKMEPEINVNIMTLKIKEILLQDQQFRGDLSTEPAINSDDC